MCKTLRVVHLLQGATLAHQRAHREVVLHQVMVAIPRRVQTAQVHRKDLGRMAPARTAQAVRMARTVQVVRAVPTARTVQAVRMVQTVLVRMVQTVLVRMDRTVQTVLILALRLLVRADLSQDMVLLHLKEVPLVVHLHILALRRVTVPSQPRKLSRLRLSIHPSAHVL